jgi:crotonobetainyl-CoA:carnitine CoA-transferase CaiB-like acyl-CoA transferase
VQARNKQSLTLNMKTEQGRQIARELALQADIIIKTTAPVCWKNGGWVMKRCARLIRR